MACKPAERTWASWWSSSAMSGETMTVGPGRSSPRQLVDRRFPRAGREHGQHVPAGDQCLDRGQLPRPQPLEAQPLPREPLNLTLCHVPIIPGLAMLIRRGCW